MDIQVKRSGNVTMIILSGTIDINSANLIETTGQLSREGHAKMLCDLKKIQAIDYSGLSILAIAYKNVSNKNCVMKFCNVPKHIKRLFKLVRLDLVFDSYENETLGIKAFETASRIDKLYLRRRFKRLEFHHPVKFSLMASSNSKVLNGKMLNISGEGMFIYAKQIFPVSTNLRLDIKLDSGKVFCVEGTVVWVADKDLQPHCYPGMGVKFVNLSSKIQNEIIGFINKNLIKRPSV